MDTYLTTQQVADALQISVATARIIIKANMPYLTIGREIRVKESAVDEFLKKGEKSARTDIQR